jgi:hypothetical protein
MNVTLTAELDDGRKIRAEVSVSPVFATGVGAI